MRIQLTVTYPPQHFRRTGIADPKPRLITAVSCPVSLTCNFVYCVFQIFLSPPLSPSYHAMPLPDERPRQSVANLIGRFEQQTKKQPASAAPSIPRSSSVASQIVGDSAKEDIKERREWPPKPVASAEKSTTTPSSNTTMSAIPSSNPTSPPNTEPEMIPPAPSKELASPTSPTSRKTPTAAKDLDHPAKPRSSMRSPTSPVKAPHGRSSIASAARASIKSPVRSPPKSSLAPSTSQPIRPQHTGQSVASNASTVRSPPSRPKTAPSTPSRPKTPAAHSPAVTNPSRPKTPSGLFAPTAASLARARNATPLVPLPTKKTTLSSSAAERLSKPTAASMSKIRGPTASPASTPPKVAKVSSAGAAGHTSTRGPSKLRVGLAPARIKEAKEREAAKRAAANATSHAEKAPLSHPEAEVDEHLVVEEHHANGNGHEEEKYAHLSVLEPEELTDVDPQEHHLHEEHSKVLSEHVEHISLETTEAGAALDSEEHPVEILQALEAMEADEASGSSISHPTAVGSPDHGESSHEHDEVESVAVVHDDPSAPQSPEEEDVFSATPDVDVVRVDEVKSRQAGNDLEDMVTLLESSVPVLSTKPRPQSIATIPDEYEIDE
ncbi:hypothetical protein SERLA73DRAFT_73557 [Serpula lacrymans var. lacrymans S7.3]|uniref:Uncharacterized protein n=1 Tax=Serpula lacrymans var. lacrymans (strain S7.3) TaxID=936435 RepID=F8PYL8_SERL3|nr:hypothetical protein SERLA73DRAFT_73557 [Serpula lacrymans var. lacrymans S7.3]